MNIFKFNPNKMNNKLTSCRCLLVLLAVMLLTSCKTATNISYMQNLADNAAVAIQEGKIIKLQPGDRLYITVSSRDEELVRIFNLNTRNNVSSSNRDGLETYTVDDKGKIDFPTLGLISVAGKSRLDVANEIKYRLLSGNFVRDAVVTVQYADMGFFALGELGTKGRIPITRDKVTILEAISEAGDLTIDGQRENVTVFRTVNGTQMPYRINLTDANSVYSSPAFYIQQNDIIYVEPTQKKANESTATANIFSTPGFWMGLASFAITLVNFLVK